MCAAENGHLDIICVLLFYYADPNITDNNGKKAIDYINNNFSKSFFSLPKESICFMYVSHLSLAVGLANSSSKSLVNFNL